MKQWYEVEVRTEIDTQEWAICYRAGGPERFESKAQALFFIERKRLNPYEKREFRVVKVVREIEQ